MAPKRGTKRAAEATMSATDEAKKMKETGGGTTVGPDEAGGEEGDRRQVMF